MDGLSPASYHKAWRRGDKTSGLDWDDTHDIGKRGAIKRRSKGKDVLVRGDNLSQARQAAQEVEKQAAKQLGKSPSNVIHHEPHDDPRISNPRPHFQTKGHKGHTFYETRGVKRHPGRGAGRGLRGAGRIGGALGLLFLAMDLVHASTLPCEEQGEAVGSALGGFAGGLAGAWAGAQAGAAIGGAFGGPVGALIGGVAGGIIGGWIGSELGSDLGGTLGASLGPRCDCP